MTPLRERAANTYSNLHGRMCTEVLVKQDVDQIESALREVENEALEKVLNICSLCKEELERAKIFLNAESLFLKIGHGDAEHQAWLKKELDQWFRSKWALAAMPNGQGG